MATIIVTGNPADGFRFIGPVTPNEPETDEFIDTHLHGEDWWMIEALSIAEATA